MVNMHLAQMKRKHLPQHQHTMRRGPREFSESDTVFHGRTLRRRRKLVAERDERKDDDHVPPALLDTLGAGRILSPDSNRVGSSRGEFHPYILRLRTTSLGGTVLYKILVCGPLNRVVGC